MATISYAWTVVGGGFTLNDETAGDQSDVAITATADGGYLGAWSVASAEVRGRYVDADGTPGTASLLNTTTSGNQFDASMALLGNGHNVVSFTDSSGGVDTIRLRILGDGAPATDFAVPANPKPQRESDVTALGSNGFAVAYTRDFGSGDTDIMVQRYDATGAAVGGEIFVDNATSQATDHASIANLAGGGFVVAWEQSAAAGGDHSVWFQLYNASGVRVTVAGDPPGNHHLIDSSGSINQDVQVAALQDGGFVVAYADNGWSGNANTDITARVYNADGTPRSAYLQVNTNTAGDQFRPTVTVLSNGYFTVGWKDGDALVYQAYSPQGIAVGSNYVPHNVDIIEAEIVGLANGEVANVRESAFSDGDGSSVRSSTHALTRTTLGTSASEALSGDGLRDLMNGGDGNDQLFGNGADDALVGGAGDDTLIGGTGADDLDGSADNDHLLGNDADDVLSGGQGFDALDGGAGIDTADYAGSAAGITIDLAAGTGSGGDAAGDTLSAIENLSGTQFADVLAGNAGANMLAGGWGDDVLRGGAGADTLKGDIGTDAASYYTSTIGVTIDLAAGTASGGDAAGDVLTSIENISGSQGNDTLAGNADANKLQGWNGGDVLRGGAGADVLEGGAGTDTASYYIGVDGVTVDLTAGTGSGGDAAGDTLSGIENLSGSQGHDILAGDAAGNKLQGWNGDDVLRGGAGADTLDGGAGSDTASYYTSAAGVAVSLATGTASGGDATADVLNSIENLSGSNLGNDGLEGNAGANVLHGWGGNDALVGGGGKDTLTGGAGADRIYFTALGDSVVGANADVITDFNHGQGDRVDLTGIDASTAVAGNQAFSFIGLNLYTGVAGQLRYSVANGVTTIAGDVNGDKVSDFHIALTGTITLIALDFVL
ncbi:MAG: beta strand repeat-containing protein [Inquilinus sp.]|uniref:beta strand repeat-containing protein n=1 Tax=Inquilinus sp. TaxID=1932117 RepID=UPI003F2B6DF7